MPDIHIHRPHQLGLSAARNVAHAWARKAEAKFGMACVYEEGAVQDVLHFNRVGVQGTLQVQADQFDLSAELGFLFGVFQGRIEAEIGAQLDKLLGAQSEAPGTQVASASESAATQNEAVLEQPATQTTTRSETPVAPPPADRGRSA